MAVVALILVFMGYYRINGDLINTVGIITWPIAVAIVLTLLFNTLLPAVNPIFLFIIAMLFAYIFVGPIYLMLGLIKLFI